MAEKAVNPISKKSQRTLDMENVDGTHSLPPNGYQPDEWKPEKATVGEDGEEKIIKSGDFITGTVKPTKEG